MQRDNFDRLCFLLVLLSLVSIIVIFVMNGSEPANKKGEGLGKAAQRDMIYRARTELIGKIYGQVEGLRVEGKSQQALLNLDELIRKYPGEAHGYILQGEILHDVGALDESIASYMRGIKINGDYLDEKSPLSRRAKIVLLVDEAQKNIKSRAAAAPQNQTVKSLQSQINYLKSRIAGGCE